MNRRGFFASLLSAAVGPPAAAAVAIRKPAQPGFVGVPYRVPQLVFHEHSFDFYVAGDMKPNVEYVADLKTHTLIEVRPA